MGTGRAACVEFARRGISVWMVDVDADELASAKEVVVAAAAPSAPAGATIESRVADVSDAGAMTEIADKVYAGGGGVHLLMNNAGVGRRGGACGCQESAWRSTPGCSRRASRGPS